MGTKDERNWYLIVEYTDLDRDPTIHGPFDFDKMEAGKKDINTIHRGLAEAYGFCGTNNAAHDHLKNLQEIRDLERRLDDKYYEKVAQADEKVIAATDHRIDELLDAKVSYGEEWSAQIEPKFRAHTADKREGLRLATEERRARLAQKEVV